MPQEMCIPCGLHCTSSHKRSQGPDTRRRCESEPGMHDCTAMESKNYNDGYRAWRESWDSYMGVLWRSDREHLNHSSAAVPTLQQPDERARTAHDFQIIMARDPM